MGRNLKFIVLNGEEQFGGELRAMLGGIDGVRVVAEVEEPALLTSAVDQFPVDVVLVNLDPNPEAVLPIVADIAKDRRALTIFAVSESTDGPLILRAMRTGVKEFLPRPIETASLVEAIDKVTVDRVETATDGKLIAVVGTSGGVGATMFASNLAVELSTLATGGVTVVDLDYRFGQVATLLDITPTYTLADLCGSPEALEASVITRALTRHSSGVHVLSRPAQFADADTITGAACMGVVSTLLQMNEYVVTDGPTRFDLGASSVLSLSDVNLLLVQLLVPCVRNAVRILERIRSDGYSLEHTKLICNRVGRDSGHLTTDNVAETLGLEVFATIPDEWSVVSAAMNLGEPLQMHSPKTRVRQAIQAVAERLHGPVDVSDDRDMRKKGLIGRIFANS